MDVRHERTYFLARVASVLLGRAGTLVLSFSLFMIGVTTLDRTVGDIPGRDGIAILCIAGAFTGVVTSFVHRERMSIAHEWMGVVMMVVSAMHGLAYTIDGIQGDRVGGPRDFFLDFTQPWVWLFAFAAGMLIWAYGRQESVRRQLRSERRG
jgi:hypothetical protein